MHVFIDRGAYPAVKVRVPVDDGDSGNGRGRFVQCSAEVCRDRTGPQGGRDAS